MGVGAWLDVSTEVSVTCANGLGRRAENCKADASCNASENSELVSTCLRKADGMQAWSAFSHVPGGLDFQPFIVSLLGQSSAGWYFPHLGTAQM